MILVQVLQFKIKRSVDDGGLSINCFLQMDQLSKSQAKWLEPLQSWILTAKNMGKIAISGSLQEKRVLASKVFGSNLVLDCKKARGYCVKPWSLLVEKSLTGGMVRDTGFEPVTPTVSM